MTGSMVTLTTIAMLVASCLLALVWLFCLVHAVQHLTDPYERTKWVLLLIVLTVFAAVVYLCSVYPRLRRQGKGRLVRFHQRPNNNSESN